MAFPLAANLHGLLDSYRARQRARQHARHLLARSPFASMVDQQLPPGLYAHWVLSACNEFEGIPVTPFFFARAAEGLLMFFDCVVRSGQCCALPSKAADSVWHAWERHSPAGLADFCIRFFGRPIAHLDAEAMAHAAEQPGPGRPLAACLVQARRADSLALGGGALPRLFTLDADYCMPFGNGYRVTDGLVAFAQLDREGKWPAQHVYPAALRPDQLRKVGLIAGTDLALSQRLPTDGGGDGGSFGAADSGSGGDSGCGDGGSACDGGSSCGSSGCGSSCGSSCGST